jgi:hypothetical protein
LSGIAGPTEPTTGAPSGYLSDARVKVLLGASGYLGPCVFANTEMMSASIAYK